jgi:hypothetical protein
MKFLFEIKIPTDVGNEKLQNGSLMKDIPRVLEEIRPEATYYGVSGGRRAIYLVVELDKSSRLPEVAELFWQRLHAEVCVNLILDAEEFKEAGSGIERVTKNKG